MQSILEQVAAATRQLQSELHTTRSSPPAPVTESPPPGEQTGGLDICFILDCPSATRNYVQLLRDNLAGIVKSVSYQLAARGGVVRVAFIGNREDGHIALDLTAEYEELVEQMRPAPLQSDELDLMEDVCDTLKQALDLSWSADSTRIIALLGDRPTRKNQAEIDELRHELSESGIHLLNMRVSDALELLITRWKVLGAGQHQVRQVDLSGMDDQRFRIALIANILDIDKRAARHTTSQRLPASSSQPQTAAHNEASRGSAPQRYDSSSASVRSEASGVVNYMLASRILSAPPSSSNAPEHPRTAFLLFAADAREEVKAANPEWAFDEVAREVSLLWKNCSESEKQRYQQLANEDMRRYEREVAGYMAARSDRAKG